MVVLVVLGLLSCVLFPPTPVEVLRREIQAFQGF